jgi:hypothetical protein
MDVDSESEGEEGEEESSAVERARALQQQESDDQQTAMHSMKHAAYEVTQPAPAAPTASSVVIRDFDPKKGEYSFP